jgi:hypothetical protein
MFGWIIEPLAEGDDDDPIDDADRVEHGEHPPTATTDDDDPPRARARTRQVVAHDDRRRRPCRRRARARRWGLDHRKLAMWTFLGSEFLFFGAFVSAYLLYLDTTAGGPGSRSSTSRSPRSARSCC